MIRDPEIREAAERLTAAWAKTLDTLPMAAEVHAVEFALHQIVDLDVIDRLRLAAYQRGTP